MTCYAVLLCAGKGTRMGKETNKIFLPLGGKPLLWHTLQAFVQCRSIDGMVLVCAKADLARCRSIAEGSNLPFPLLYTAGGKERQDSVRNGLAALPEGTGIVAIHDAARPFTAPEVISACIGKAKETGACITAMPSTDTVKEVQNGVITATRDRRMIWLAQTPQVFKTDVIRNAHRLAEEKGYYGTDDAQLVEALGLPVSVVEGGHSNIKLTTSGDMLTAETILKNRGVPSMRGRMRTGTGFDAHRLAEGRRLILGGVEIPHEKGLLGHSDADVLVHAIMDALLGAAALGDIGMHFPDTSDEYKDISSLALLARVGAFLEQHGYGICNIDSTVVAQTPKLRPHIGAMTKNIAATLKIPMECVNIKATTTEEMGFTGRKEGICAQASACIEKL